MQSPTQSDLHLDFSVKGNVVSRSSKISLLHLRLFKLVEPKGVRTASKNSLKWIIRYTNEKDYSYFTLWFSGGRTLPMGENYHLSDVYPPTQSRKVLFPSWLCAESSASCSMILWVQLLLGDEVGARMCGNSVSMSQIVLLWPWKWVIWSETMWWWLRESE